jgi:hypothetical protein
MSASRHRYCNSQKRTKVNLQPRRITTLQAERGEWHPVRRSFVRILTTDVAAASFGLTVEVLQAKHPCHLSLSTAVLLCMSLEFARMREQIRNLRRSNTPVSGAYDATRCCITSLTATFFLSHFVHSERGGAWSYGF